MQRTAYRVNGYEIKPQILRHIQSRARFQGFLAMAVRTHSPGGERFVAWTVSAQHMPNKIGSYAIGHLTEWTGDFYLKTDVSDTWDEIGMERSIGHQLSQFAELLGNSHFGHFLGRLEAALQSPVLPSWFALVENRTAYESRRDAKVMDCLPYPLGMFLGACRNAPDLVALQLPLLHHLRGHIRLILPNLQ